MKDRIKKFWEDHKDYVRPALLIGGVGVAVAAVARGAHKSTPSSPVEDDSIKIDNWVDADGRGLTVITEPDTDYDLPGWNHRPM